MLNVGLDTLRPDELICLTYEFAVNVIKNLQRRINVTYFYIAVRNTPNDERCTKK